jgi:type IV pilus assembly protein PilX
MMNAAVPSRRATRGATLVVALILLALMTVMGVFATRSAIFQEKSSANDLDRSVAMQAAELAMRDAEKDIMQRQTDGSFCTAGTAGCRDVALYVEGLLTNNFFPGCTLGLCDGDPVAKPWIDDPTLWNDARSVVYSTWTHGDNPIQQIASVSQQPRYIIEKFVRSYAGVVARPLYRITVMGYGRSANTQVMLQSVFVPPI